MSVEMQTVKVNQTTKKDPVKKGALIGTGTALGLMGGNFLINSHKLKKMTGDGFFKTVNKSLNEAVELCGGDKKAKGAAVAAMIASITIVLAGVSAISAGIGAGIGKLVKNHNEKKEAEKQEIIEQVKTELEEN